MCLRLSDPIDLSMVAYESLKSFKKNKYLEPKQRLTDSRLHHLSSYNIVKYTIHLLLLLHKKSCVMYSLVIKEITIKTAPISNDTFFSG